MFFGECMSILARSVVNLVVHLDRAYFRYPILQIFMWPKCFNRCISCLFVQNLVTSVLWGRVICMTSQRMIKASTCTINSIILGMSQ